MSFEITGIDTLRRALDRMDKVSTLAGRALYQEAERVMTASKELVPVDTGFLRSTGHVREPVISGSRIEVTLGYNATYALPVHERLDVFHKVGQAKYLEQPLMEAMDGMADRVMAVVMEDITK